jgi:DNA-binding NtrC family response regulator
MKSIQRAHIVLVAGSDHGLALAARLLRIEAARVTAVASLEEARGMCHAGGADACIIAFDDALPDAPSVAEQDSPGRQCGVPSLMVVPAVTRYQRMAARRQGYFAAVPGTIAPQMLYRRISAALQWRAAASRKQRMPVGTGMPIAGIVVSDMLGKPTLH